MIKLNRYYTYLNLLVITAVVYCGVNIFYSLLGSRLQKVSPGIVVVPSKDVTPKQTSAEIRSQPPFASYRAAIDRHLFGKEEEKVGKGTNEDTEEEVVPEKITNLNVTLLGTISGDDEVSRAIIEDKAKKEQKLYKQGDAIQNAQVESILRGKVILKVGPEKQILVMEEKNVIKKDDGKGIGPRGRRPLRRSQSPAPYTPMSSKVIKLSKSDIASSLSDLTQVMSQARVRIHYDRGNPDGLMLSSVRPGSMLQKMGLRNGDIIQKIDGESIESPDDIMGLYEELKSGAGVALDIRRRGRNVVHNYEFQ